MIAPVTPPPASGAQTDAERWRDFRHAAAEALAAAGEPASAQAVVMNLPAPSAPPLPASGARVSVGGAALDQLRGLVRVGAPWATVAGWFEALDARPLPDVDEARRLVGGLFNAAFWLGATYEGSPDEHAVAERRLIFQRRDAARAALLAALGVADDDAGGAS